MNAGARMYAVDPRWMSSAQWADAWLGSHVGSEPGMKVHTESERVRTSRKMVLEFLASSADLSLAAPEVRGWLSRYDADPGRYGGDA